MILIGYLKTGGGGRGFEQTPSRPATVKKIKHSLQLVVDFLLTSIIDSMLISFALLSVSLSVSLSEPLGDVGVPRLCGAYAMSVAILCE